MKFRKLRRNKHTWAARAMVICERRCQSTRREPCHRCGLRACRALLVFFFQAEAGIRAKLVTGVQTCALPISRPCRQSRCGCAVGLGTAFGPWREIGRASCREGVWFAVVEVSLARKQWR